MTRFLDGPAQSAKLMLRRAAYWLRVTECAGKIDALDQPEDTPNANEKLYAYMIAEKPSTCHVRMSGGRGGFYPIAVYRLSPVQPTDAQMRDTAAWKAWTETQPKPQI